MKVSKNQYDAVVGLIGYNGQNGDRVEVSTSQYSSEVVRDFGLKLEIRTSHGNAATMRGLAKRGLIEWDGYWRAGRATILDIDGLRAIAEAY